MRPDAGLLMLEVHEHIGARSRAAADGLRPAPEVLGRVALVAQTKIAVARRDLDGGREFLAVGDAEREILRPEPLEHLGVHPRRVPELERGAGVRGKDAEKRIEHREILAEIRRQLEEDRAELGSERRCGPQKVLQEVRAIAQLRDVRDALGGLEGQPEPLRRLAVPAGEDLLVRRAIERVVDLDRLEALGVVRQHLRRRELLRIEAALPFGVVVARGSDPMPRHVLFMQGVLLG